MEAADHGDVVHAREVRAVGIAVLNDGRGCRGPQAGGGFAACKAGAKQADRSGANGLGAVKHYFTL